MANTRKITVDIKITVNDVDYVLVGYSSGWFWAYGFSSVTWFRKSSHGMKMRNGKISRTANTFPLDGFRDDDSILLVYAREDTLLQINRDWTNPFWYSKLYQICLWSFMAPLVDTKCYEKLKPRLNYFTSSYLTLYRFDFESTAPILPSMIRETLPDSVFEVFDASILWNDFCSIVRSNWFRSPYCSWTC